MKKKHYWIGGIILLALILLYYFRGNISKALGIGSTTRQFRTGGIAGSGGMHGGLSPGGSDGSISSNTINGINSMVDRVTNINPCGYGFVTTYPKAVPGTNGSACMPPDNSGTWEQFEHQQHAFGINYCCWKKK